MIRRVQTRAQGHVCQRHHHRAGAISGALCLGRMEKSHAPGSGNGKDGDPFGHHVLPLTHILEMFFCGYAANVYDMRWLVRTVVVVVSFCMRWCNKRYVLQQIKSSGAPMKQDHLFFLTTVDVCNISGRANDKPHTNQRTVFRC